VTKSPPSLAVGADLRLGDMRWLGAALWTNNMKLLVIWRAALMPLRGSSTEWWYPVPVLRSME